MWNEIFVPSLQERQGKESAASFGTALTKADGARCFTEWHGFKEIAQQRLGVVDVPRDPDVL